MSKQELVYTETHYRPYPRRTIVRSLSSLICIIVLLSPFLSTWITLVRIRGKQTNLHGSFLKGKQSKAAFATILEAPALRKNDKRLTLIATWKGDRFQEYLRHFMHTAQLNREVLDIIFINHARDGARCLDFREHEVDIEWGGNVKHVCITSAEWTRRHANFFCEAEAGWNCSRSQHLQVWKKFDDKLTRDPKNTEFHPFIGLIFQDYLPSDHNGLWGWTDVDMILGRFDDFPFNVLAQVSLMLTSHTPQLFMHGQMTFFNNNDRAMRSAWKNETDLRDVESFLNSSIKFGEEKYWSRSFLRSDEMGVGPSLDWAAVPYPRTSEKNLGASKVAVLSGKDLIVLDSKRALSVEHIQALLENERYKDYSNIDALHWTASSDFQTKGQKTIFDELRLLKGLDCNPPTWMGEADAQCFLPHPLEQNLLGRASYLRQKGSDPGLIFRRIDPRPLSQGYTKAAFMHFLFLKKCLSFPNFEILDSMAMIIDNRSLKVFSLREDRSLLYESVCIDLN